MQNLLGFLLFLIPRNVLSHYTGKVCDVTLPKILPKFLQKMVLQAFVKKYKINMGEASKPLSEYNSINAVFTRQLKVGARSIDEQGLLVHPADSRLTQGAWINSGKLIQAKGKEYSLEKFVVDSNWAKSYKDGHFLTYYLCPTDYHRVHSPIDGKIVKVSHIPGTLWPVNDWSTGNIKELFAVNERVIIEIESREIEGGKALLVMVGATNVGKITLAFDEEVISNNLSDQNSRSGIIKEYSEPITIKKGAEVGTFHLGSTVVMIYNKKIGEMIFTPSFGQVKLGEKLSVKAVK